MCVSLLACASCLLMSVIDLPSPAKPSPRVFITNPASSLTGLRSTYSSNSEVLRFNNKCNRHAAGTFLHHKIWPAGQKRDATASLDIVATACYGSTWPVCMCICQKVLLQAAAPVFRQLQQRATLNLCTREFTAASNHHATLMPPQHRGGGQMLLPLLQCSDSLAKWRLLCCTHCSGSLSSTAAYVVQAK